MGESDTATVDYQKHIGEASTTGLTETYPVGLSETVEAECPTLSEKIPEVRRVVVIAPVYAQE